ncbi:class I SAM-dependent methyltransferase [Bacillus salitolerans]|uniref:Class I SAM-dependent methyltransferase n=1 Tax=Bacillus salitolerans TaxID=1437434 RepID=A0ABW4LVX1_9BACI
MEQKIVSKINQTSWNQSVYKAWINRYGTPEEYAKQLSQYPTKAVSHYLKFMGEVKGKKVANLLGSKGNKAVSLSLLGASVSVFDISEENKRYALELAKQANTKINYIVTDVLDIPEECKLTDCDFVLLEIGVLHYFVDLTPLFKVVYDFLKPNGKLILRDYHPYVAKTMKVVEGEFKRDGNYFENNVVDEDVAYTILLSEKERSLLPKVKIRRWTLGEIVTSISKSGLNVEYLEEEQGIRWAFPPNAPEGIEEKVPGLFTLVARKE